LQETLGSARDNPVIWLNHPPARSRSLSFNKFCATGGQFKDVSTRITKHRQYHTPWEQETCWQKGFHHKTLGNHLLLKCINLYSENSHLMCQIQLLAC
jgi:hypothetical protein